MAGVKTKIVYLAHTQKRILDDAVFSILNLIHQGLEHDDCEVIIGTDQPQLFAEMPVSVWPITQQDIEEWKGSIDFIHRTKAVFLSMVSEKYPDHNILYFDADTAVKVDLGQLLESVGNGNSIMHAGEGTVNQAKMPVYKQVGKWIGSEKLKVPGLLDCKMFNAGVIGVPASNTDVFRKVVAMVDEYYPSLRVHILEQMFFSYLLSQRTHVLDSSKMVLHWWGKGLNTGPLISAFLRSSTHLPLSERASKASELVVLVESAPMNPKLSFSDKMKRSLKKRFG